MQRIFAFLTDNFTTEIGEKDFGNDVISETVDKLKKSITYLDNKIFVEESNIHFESDKLQRDIKNWIDKERQKIHYLEETRHDLLEKNLKKQSKIRETQDSIVWGRAKNEEIILDNAVVLTDINELYEKNQRLRSKFAVVIEKTRELEVKRREQLKIFKELYETTPSYKNKETQTDDDVTIMISKRRDRKRDRKVPKEKGVQCEILAERARIIGHKGCMTDKEVPLILFEETEIVSEVSEESLLTKSSEIFEDCMQNLNLLDSL